MAGIGLIGGGRWARVHASVLMRMGVPQVTLCSPANRTIWEQSLPEWPATWRVADLAQVMADAQIRHLIIARRARDHAATAILGLNAGKSVLVEKPFCLTSTEATAILAQAQGRDVHTGLVFRYARYLRTFCELCLAKGPPRALALDWADPVAEIRHGQIKSHDPALNVVQDVLPHAWSILRPYMAGAMRVDVGTVAGGGAQVDLTLFAGQSVAHIRLRRAAQSRVRMLTVEGADYQAKLDFSVEPGLAWLNGEQVDVASQHQSPLELELRAFLTDTNDPLTNLAHAREAIDLAQAAMSKIRDRQRDTIKSGISRLDPDVDYALREVSEGGIDADGRPATIEALATWLPLADKDRLAFLEAWTRCRLVTRT